MKLIKTLDDAKDIFCLQQESFEVVFKGRIINQLHKTDEYDESLEYKCIIDLKKRKVSVL